MKLLENKAYNFNGKISQIANRIKIKIINSSGTQQVKTNSKQLLVVITEELME
jgi:hypothetical protein